MISPRILQSINSQYHQHAHRNLYYQGTASVLPWTRLTCELLTDCPEEILALEDTHKSREVVSYLTMQARQAFCHTNQYLDISTAHTDSLQQVYARLVEDIIGAVKDRRIDEAILSARHSVRLREWLRASNPFTEKAFAVAGRQLEPVVCAEYEATLQLEVLQLNTSSITGPLLDIGCGPEAYLVKYLRSQGIQAYGVDRFIAAPAAFLQVGDWLDFSLPPGYWGTIVSNLSFSNHFLHHHHRNSPECARYARKYMEILQALRPGGSYHYAPSLPMMEVYLPASQYTVSNIPVTAHFSATVVTKKATVEE
ncbi:class I SAM-dependent methyltransferase [Chitinophaga sp. HK235]|uniref:class I SAM-dependent methyltransferase n=1 Tax=Chitinophaga sp. HK235 TaxID=2952571 RepID=UPI001BA607D3|nr:class I SAM-dependent methyltransferase [Chitinophaga sp. HK235]